MRLKLIVLVCSFALFFGKEACAHRISGSVVAKIPRTEVSFSRSIDWKSDTHHSPSGGHDKLIVPRSDAASSQYADCGTDVSAESCYFHNDQISVDNRLVKTGQSGARLSFKIHFGRSVRSQAP